jgi:hypothetical protein
MKMAWTNVNLIRKFRDRVHTVKSEDMVKNPEIQLRKICEFLNIKCSKKYITDCISTINSEISRSRNGIVWDKDVKDFLIYHMERIPFYRDYL